MRYKIVVVTAAATFLASMGFLFAWTNADGATFGMPKTCANPAVADALDLPISSASACVR